MKRIIILSVTALLLLCSCSEKAAVSETAITAAITTVEETLSQTTTAEITTVKETTAEVTTTAAETSSEETTAAQTTAVSTVPPTAASTSGTTTAVTAAQTETSSGIIEPIGDPEELSEEAAERMCRDYAAYYGHNKREDEVEIVAYYGTYNGYEAAVYCVDSDNGESIISVYNVADHWIEINAGEASGIYEMVLYKDSEFITLNEAYSLGYLTDSDIAKIAYYVTEKKGSYKNQESVITVSYPDLEKPTYEAVDKILSDYADLIGGNTTADDVGISSYYGTYNGCEAVVMYELDCAVTDDMFYFKVAGYNFRLGSSSYRITLHSGSEFIELKEAYSMGYLTKDDIAQIAYYNNESKGIWIVKDGYSEFDE